MQLIQKQKEQVCKDRTNRFCKRIELFEKLLTEEQFNTFWSRPSSLNIAAAYWMD